MKTVSLADRDIRQRDLVPPDRLGRCHAMVIGVGAVGRQVALQLAATGVPALSLYDPDTVNVENLAVQGFRESDVGLAKVAAVADACRQQFSQIALRTHPERFRKSSARGWPGDRDIAVFCCVDAIETRKLIWESVRATAAFFVDGRMNAEVVRVLASGRPALDAAYSATLFAAGEAFAGACTARSTIYSANIAAGLMVGQFARWLRGLPVIADQTINLFAAEFSATDTVR